MVTSAHTRRRVTRGIVLVLLSASALTALSGAHAPLPARSATHEEEYEEHEGRAPTKAELEPSVEAAFARESYRPGTTARLVVFNRARGITLQIFRVGAERVATRGNSEMQGVAVTAPAAIGSAKGRRFVRVSIGSWPSGLYFARLEAADGRVGFAPLFVRPHRLGEHRVAVVLPTLTWQAYNLRDDDGDGTGDSWYAAWKKTTARLNRPFLNRGVPYNFRAYDLPFLRWLAATGKEVDVLSDADLGSAASGAALIRAYDLIVFPGHHEYVTAREYDLVERYRDLGGNLMFLSANNFFWRVIRHGNVIEKTKQWRELGRPEAALIGVQYRANDRGTHRRPWIVRRSADSAWVFAGTGLRAGAAFSSGGVEIDKTAPSSPRSVRVLAEIPNLLGPGLTAQMTYYETARGARVFAAGAFTLAGAVRQQAVSTVLGNLWERLTSDAEPRLMGMSGGRLEASFADRSYAPGRLATLALSGTAGPATLRLYRAGHGRQGPMQGRQVGQTLDGSVPGRFRVRIGDWPSGLYYARVSRPDGERYAPFVLRPRRLGEHRVAVVFPTNTWQAYNFRDDDGDGDKDTWYADSSEPSVLLSRPYAGNGVPPHYRGYDRGFVRWLALREKQADFLSDDDLERLSGERLARAYDLIVFPGHHEYVATHAYDAVERYRNLGGNLAFLSANNFFYRVIRRGDRIYRAGRWRDLGRPEAALVGIQYVDWNHNVYGNKPYTVVGPGRAPWLFRGTGLARGDQFGVYGIEIDARAPSSPRGLRILCRIPDAFGPGKSAEMSYYETARGAKVFAAGVINFGGSSLWPVVSTMTGNLWTRLSRP